MRKSLIEAQELYQLLNQQQPVVVIDTRFDLQNKALGHQQYLEGHLPGALFLDLEQDLSGPLAEHGGRHPLPDPARLAQTLGRAGIVSESLVVVYDQSGGMFAGRLWWLLRWLGHDQVKLIDGGLPAWLAAGYALETAIPEVQPQSFKPEIRAHLLVELPELEARLHEPELTLLDARAAERYRGEVEPLDPQAGHIPGALNRPFSQNLQDGRFKSPDILRQELQALGLRPEQEIIVYCGSGVTASHDLIALEEAGFQNARLYAGSWSDWCSYPEHPIETGSR